MLNRYVSGDPVVGAAITFDHDNEDAKTPRTASNGSVTVRTELLTDGNHVVRELQTDLRDIGYFAPLDGNFDELTQFAVMMFQKHFFSGSRRTLINPSDRGTVGRVTAEFIKRVRP